MAIEGMIQVYKRNADEVLMEALEEERAEIAATLRSETAQILTSVLVGLTAAAESEDLERVRALLGDLRDSVRADLGRTQALASHIRPSVLDDFGLEAAVRGLARTLTSDDGPSIDVMLSGVDSMLRPSQSGLVFRTLEEAICNARRYADATCITVASLGTPAGLRFEVRDNGRGFDIALAGQGPPGGRGLLLMQARARALGGTLRFTSKPGVGTRVVLRVPRGKSE